MKEKEIFCPGCFVSLDIWRETSCICNEPFSLYSAPDKKREYTKIQENRRSQRKMEIRKCMLEDQGPRGQGGKKERDYKTLNSFDWIKLFKASQ